MEKDKLKNRLAEIEKAINNKNNTLQQITADINVLLGCKTECLYWISQDSNNIEPIKMNVINEDNPLSMDELKNMLGADKIELA